MYSSLGLNELTKQYRLSRWRCHPSEGTTSVYVNLRDFKLADTSFIYINSAPVQNEYAI